MGGLFTLGPTPWNFHRAFDVDLNFFWHLKLLKHELRRSIRRTLFSEIHKITKRKDIGGLTGDLHPWMHATSILNRPVIGHTREIVRAIKKQHQLEEGALLKGQLKQLWCGVNENL